MTLDELEKLAEEFTYPCINEGVIKELIALCRMQHEVLKEMETCTLDEWEAALATYERFDKGE